MRLENEGAAIASIMPKGLMRPGAARLILITKSMDYN
jgi:hypothetical protein